MYFVNSLRTSKLAVWMLSTLIAAFFAGNVTYAQTLGETVTISSAPAVQSGMPITEGTVSVQKPVEVDEASSYEVVTRKLSKTIVKEYRRQGQVEFVEVIREGSRPYYVNYTNDPLGDHNTAGQTGATSKWMLRRW